MFIFIKVSLSNIKPYMQVELIQIKFQTLKVRTDNSGTDSSFFKND